MTATTDGTAGESKDETDGDEDHANRLQDGDFGDEPDDEQDDTQDDYDAPRGTRRRERRRGPSGCNWRPWVLDWCE